MNIWNSFLVNTNWVLTNEPFFSVCVFKQYLLDSYPEEGRGFCWEKYICKIKNSCIVCWKNLYVEIFFAIADNKFGSKNILHVCWSGNAITYFVTLSLQNTILYVISMRKYSWEKYIWQLGILLCLREHDKGQNC